MKNKMPVLFIGHGSPMNAIEKNKFTETLAALGKRIPKPKAILCVSAHWLTEGSFVTAMETPRTIHDFYGFPKALFEVQYPAPGDVTLADKVCSMISDPKVKPDYKEWGLDHGTWSVLKHMYPDADISVVQLSIDGRKSPEYHFELGKKLRSLREEGVLILGSGNIVHNLRRLNWDQAAPPFDWAIEFDGWVKEKLLSGEKELLVTDSMKTEAGKLSIPTEDHYQPLYYVLGASEDNDRLKFEYEGIDLGSISMRSFSYSV